MSGVIYPLCGSFDADRTSAGERIDMTKAHEDAEKILAEYNRSLGGGQKHGLC